MVDLAPGLWLSDWILEEPLGEGGFSVVYAARHATDGREAAVKVPTDSRYVSHLRTHPEGLRLDHPCVVRTLEEQLAHDPPFVVLERLGGNLRGALDDGPLGPQRVVEIVRDVAAGLDHAHQEGVLHLDVKPENVLLEAEGGRARLTDFGAAGSGEEARVLRQSLSFSTAEMGATGTWDYAAPEVRYGDGAVDRRADVYGLGVLAFELLTGRLPLGLDRPSELNPGLSAQVDDVLARALARDPARRTLSAGEFARDLAQALQAAPVPAVTDDPTEPAPRGWTVLVLAVCMAILTGVGAVTLVQQNWPSQPSYRLGPELVELLRTVPAGTRVGVFPVEDLGAESGWIRTRGLTLAESIAASGEASLPKLLELNLPESADSLYERPTRDQLAREGGCELAIHGVLPPGARLPLQEGVYFLVDLATYEIRQATPVDQPVVGGLAEGVARALTRSDGRPVAVLPSVDKVLRVSNRWTATFDLYLTAALVRALAGRAPVRARAGIVPRLRALGSDPPHAISASQVIEGEYDATRKRYAVRLRDVTNGITLFRSEIPWVAEGYRASLQAERFTADAGALELLPLSGEPLIRKTIDQASALLYRGETARAASLLEGLRARGKPYDQRLEPLRLLARARVAEKRIPAALRLYEQGLQQHATSAKLRREYAQLCLDEAGRMYRRGKQPWYKDDDEDLFEKARDLLLRLDGLDLEEKQAREIKRLRKRVEGEL